MSHRSLRYAAALDVLEMARTEDLIDAAHEALDYSVYSYSLGELATTRDPRWHDCRILFRSALQEMGLQLPTVAAAIQTLLEYHATRCAEGVNEPSDTLYQLYDIDRAIRTHDEWLAGLPPETTEWLSRFTDLYYRVDEVIGYQSYLHEQGASARELPGTEEIYSGAVTLAVVWCQDRWVPSLDPSWRTSAVVGLSRGIADELAFDRLPVLADALEDAGCSDPDWLTHLRERNPHVTRCVLVDLLLDRSD